MSFNAFNAVRTSARRAANFTAPAARSSRQTLRTNGFRRGYSTTEPPASGTGQKTSYTLPIGVGAVLAAAGGYYFLTSDAPRQAETLGKEAVQIAKAATHFTPSKEDYQKVCNGRQYVAWYMLI
jgi:cytochrome c peroxidase